MLLVAILNDDRAAAASHIAAAETILNRGYGRPAQSSDLTIRKTSVEEMSDAELMAIAAGDDEEDEKEEGVAMRRIIAADRLAKTLGISLDEVFQIARTRQVPCR